MVVNYIIRRLKLFYSSSEKFQNLARRITTSSLYFGILKARIKNQIKKDKMGPFNLVIETTNFCNARCMICPYSKMKRSKKIMTEEIFKKIIERIKEENLAINKIFFSGMGEPLTDPNLVGRIRAIKNLEFPVRLYTNGSLLTSEVSRKLVSEGLDEINISFNGTTPLEYKKIMNLDFEKTVKNIENLLRIKKELGRRLPFVQISLVSFSANEKSLDTHLKNWQGKADSVTVSLAHQWGGKVKISSKFKVQSSKLIYPCRSLWHTFNIDSSGNFVVCCRDYESRYVLGNIKKNSFSQVYKSPILKRFRRLHLKYSQAKLPKICQFCNFPYQGGVEWFLPRFID